MLGLIFFTTLLSCCLSFTFNLSATSSKCFTEELPNDYDVTAMYEAKPGYSQLIDIRVTDHMGSQLLEKTAIDKGQINFKTTIPGDHHICFYNRLVPGVRYRDDMQREIKFELLAGQESVDYAQVARKQHLKPVEINLRIMEDAVKQIHMEYHYFKAREAEMRTTNESNNSRAMWITILNMGIFLGFASWQVLHLKKFFISKKLISG
jgi:hypothetical protein